MHLHFGLQEQLLGTAPLILQTEEQQDKADEQYVILLGDFSFKPAGQILTKLKAGMKKMKGMSGMTAMRNNRRLVAQKWDDVAQSNLRCEQPWRLGVSLPYPLSFGGRYVYGPEIRRSQYRILATG